MTDALKITVSFNDSTIPANVLASLSETAAIAVFDYFAEKLLKSKDIDPKTPYTYSESEWRSQTLALAKDAFDRHRSVPQPGDDAQLVINRISVLADSLSATYGPTTTKALHPRVWVS